MVPRGRRGERWEVGGLGGLNREVCGAQLFPIQSGAVFANTLNARSEETSEGELTD